MTHTNARPLAYRITDLATVLNISRQTIYVWERDGILPRRVELSAGVRVWRAADIEAWLAARPEAPPASANRTARAGA